MLLLGVNETFLFIYPIHTLASMDKNFFFINLLDKDTSKTNFSLAYQIRQWIKTISYSLSYKINDI